MGNNVMNAAERMTSERRNRILQIAALINKAGLQKKVIDEKLFVNEICLAYGVTSRTAKEYIELAKFEHERGN